MIFRSIVFTIGFALGAAAQAIAQLATPTAAPQPVPATVAPSPTTSVSQTPAPSPTATETPGPTGAPAVTPTPSVTPTVTPTATPTATATPGVQFKYVVDPTPDPSMAPGGPQILRIEINDRTVHVGGQFACRIMTTPNVASVVLSVEGHQIGIPKAQDGVFAGQQGIPGFIPPWFLKTYQITFNALTADGKKTSATLPVTLAY